MPRFNDFSRPSNYISVVHTVSNDISFCVSDVRVGEAYTSISSIQKQELINYLAGEPVFTKSQIEEALKPLSSISNNLTNPYPDVFRGVRHSEFITLLIYEFRKLLKPKPEQTEAQKKAQALQETIEKAQKELEELQKEIG